MFVLFEAERVSFNVDVRAAMKAKINSIWEELKGKDSLPAKVGLPKVQKVSKPNKPSKSVPVSFAISTPIEFIFVSTL